MMATAADILGVNGKPKVPARWAKHYQWLCADKERLLGRDRSSPEASSIKLDDLPDAASEESQRCLSLVAAKATQASLVDVVDAIRRIERGTYGICEITGKPIESARLRAIPWTRYSIEGQKELERAGFGHKRALPTLERVSGASSADDDEAGPEEAEDKEAA